MRHEDILTGHGNKRLSGTSFLDGDILWPALRAS